MNRSSCENPAEDESQQARLRGRCSSRGHLTPPSPQGDYGTTDGVARRSHWAQTLMAISQETARVPGWQVALAASPTGTRPFDRAYARLRKLAEGLPEDRHVVHGDLVNHNVLVQGPRITAVIDWGNALYGDWLHDPAWLIFWWPWFPQWRDIDITAELERHWDQHGGLPPGLHHRLHACLVHIGLDAMAYNAYRRPLG